MSLIKIKYMVGRTIAYRIGEDGEAEENLKRETPSAYILKIEPFKNHEDE